MSAERSKREIGDPSAVSMRVERIESLTQLEGRFEFDPERAPDEGDSMVPLNGLGVPEVSQSGNRVLAMLNYSFQAMIARSESPEGDAQSGDPVFSASARFLVVYQLDSEEPAEDASLRAFAEINGRLNTVPYWREYLHNALARAGFPPYEVPPFNPVRIARELERPKNE